MIVHGYLVNMHNKSFNSLSIMTLLICCLLPCGNAFAAYVNHRWQVGIGDPNAVGWLAVFSYCVAAYLSFLCAQQCKLAKLPSTFWQFMCAFLILLAINKQLDLQTLLTQIGRDFAREYGLYQNRRKLQLLFVVFMFLAGVALIGYLKTKMRRVWQEYRMVCMGLIMLVVFIFIRMASFHHIDSVLRLHLFSVKLHQWLELMALLVIIVGTYRWLRYAKTYDLDVARHLLD